MYLYDMNQHMKKYSNNSDKSDSDSRINILDTHVLIQFLFDIIKTVSLLIWNGCQDKDKDMDVTKEF